MNACLILALAAPPSHNPAPPKNTYGFYLVWNPQGNSPTRRHATLKQAQEEAERLARKHKNQSFYVMKSVTVDRCFVENVAVRGATHFFHETEDTPPDPHMQ